MLFKRGAILFAKSNMHELAARGMATDRQIADGRADCGDPGASLLNRTDTPFGIGILNAARLRVPPRPHAFYRRNGD
jgi:hypothetical protein